jgi:hypothetical protein
MADPRPHLRRDPPGPRDLLQVVSRSWSRRAQVKVGALEERLSFDPESDDFLDGLVPFHEHPAYRRLSPRERSRVLTCGWIAYNAKTVAIETEVVTPACTALLRADLAGVDDAWAQRAIAETMVDEAYHVYLAITVTNLSKQARGLDPPLPPFALARQVRERAAAATSSRSRAIVQLAVATVSELLISGYLAQLSTDTSIQPVHRESVAAHWRDERAHSSIFAELAERVCQKLRADEVDDFVRALADAALWFADAEWDVWASLLEYLDIGARSELIADFAPAQRSGRLRPGNYEKLIEFAAEAALLERPACREAFAQVGLIAGP